MNKYNREKNFKPAYFKVYWGTIKLTSWYIKAIQKHHYKYLKKFKWDFGYNNNLRQEAILILIIKEKNLEKLEFFYLKYKSSSLIINIRKNVFY